MAPRSENAPKPVKAVLKTYNVGFGDCFLFSVEYDNGDERRVLIDCGSMKSPPNTKNWIKKVVTSINEECGGDKDNPGKLHVVVATHRHKDHISAFASKTTGGMLEAMNPDIVIQPWTEDPDIPEDATAPLDRDNTPTTARRSLAMMNLFAENLFGQKGESKSLSHLERIDEKTFQRLSFIGEDNVRNRQAVERLIKMGKGGKARYVHAKMPLDLSDLLPGVEIEVLGPPTTEQWADIKQMARTHEEFWHIAALSSMQAGSGGPDPFPNIAGEKASRDQAWVRYRLKRVELNRLYRIVTTLDRTLNNTSLILLFRVGDKSFLFPGDAQIENWSFALGDDEVVEKLKDVDVYKVGHHGSLNATPKSLWEHFEKKGKKSKPGRLTTVLSSLDGKHGKVENKTEVPRRTLVKALKSNSDLVHTQELDAAKLFERLEWDV